LYTSEQLPKFDLQNLKFNDQGLIPVIAQDASTGQVLMLAWANQQSIERTLESGQAWYWSRSRQELWHKGATSGNIQQVQEIFYDCDGDALLIRINPAGPACHTGQPSCFFRRLEP
jgi:phosphoribosyl-AMP cyclohydrolase